MAVHNADIAEVFTKIADLLEIQGANPFRVRAYRNAARTIGDHPQSMAALLQEGQQLWKLPGIGKDLAGKIAEIVESGSCAALRELEREMPPVITELLTLPSLGPKKAAAVHRELGVRTLEELAAAAEAKKLRTLKGFGPKSEEKLLAEIRRHAGAPKRFKISVAEQVVETLVACLKEMPGVGDVTAAGSYRRRLETVGDLDILVTCAESAAVMDRFTGYEEVREILAKGGTKSSVRLRSGLQVDIRVVPEASYGAALHYFTGSKAHNIAIRQMGVKKGLKINEYGVFRDEERIAGRTEEEVFAQVGLPYILPELRENRGEIEAAQKGALPKLIVLEDIRGDLHAHTRETDGRATLEQMAEAARQRGYAYLAITEHSRSLAMARGLDPVRLRQQIAAIDRLNETSGGLRLLKAIELDILEDGSLDLPDDVLAELDLTVCSIHSRFNLPRDRQTERLLRAMDNRHFHILAHPTGRLIGERDPYDVDLEKVLQAAAERGCCLELNAHPDRLDLDDIHCKMAKEMGIKLSIATDAHFTTDLGFMRFGIGQARRGWLEKDDVLNTRPVEEMLKLLRRK
jgi:DNA polymerase (family 10)